MLRILSILSFCLLIAFTGIGVLLSRQWGWSEYASPQLYVLYSEAASNLPPSFFSVSADGSDGSPLTSNAGTLSALACSPDGHTLAFLTASGRLSVVNQSGVLYDRALGVGYDAINLANNGTVAAFQTVYGMGIVVNANGSTIPVPPDHNAHDPIKIASSGASLWSHTAIGGIKLLSPSGDELFAITQGASAPVWLSSEQMFTFTYPNAGTDQPGGIVDAARREVVPFHRSVIPFGVLSPDARLEVLRFLVIRTSHEQLFIVDPLTAQPKQQLTDDAVFHTPLCFLTFRPQILIAGS